jgi:hypothetical protein
MWANIVVLLMDKHGTHCGYLEHSFKNALLASLCSSLRFMLIPYSAELVLAPE